MVGPRVYLSPVWRNVRARALLHVLGAEGWTRSREQLAQLFLIITHSYSEYIEHIAM